MAARALALHRAVPCTSTIVIVSCRARIVFFRIVLVPAHRVSAKWSPISVGNQTCDVAGKNKDDFACCFANSKCVPSKNGAPGYLCNCSQGYEETLTIVMDATVQEYMIYQFNRLGIIIQEACISWEFTCLIGRNNQEYYSLRLIKSAILIFSKAY
jgi:hypothetical protein